MVSDELIDVKSYVFICLGSVGKDTFLATFHLSRNPKKINMIFEKILHGWHMITHNKYRKKMTFNKDVHKEKICH